MITEIYSQRNQEKKREKKKKIIDIEETKKM